MPTRRESSYTGALDERGVRRVQSQVTRYALVRCSLIALVDVSRIDRTWRNDRYLAFTANAGLSARCVQDPHAGAHRLAVTKVADRADLAAFELHDTHVSTAVDYVDGPPLVCIRWCFRTWWATLSTRGMWVDEQRASWRRSRFVGYFLGCHL